jgi:hypothetical protein
MRQRRSTSARVCSRSIGQTGASAGAFVTVIVISMTIPY